MTTWPGQHSGPGPDPAPAIALRERLAALRAEGVAFPDAWPLATAAALEVAREACRTDGAYGEWRVAFRWTRPAWREAYCKVGPSPRRTGPLPVEEGHSHREKVLLLG